ncbi:class D sortase [Bacillus sp. REN3]|uniref:class D sortase n=1 Tax=Bacillus sp. REN3 TaxID=2802440 RepID=UPI001AEF1CA2|nr:class D sortase [Bacillus sp. REN3]
MRRLAIVFIIGGVLVLGIGLWQLWDIERQEKVSLEAARELIQADKQKDSKQGLKVKTGDPAGLLLIPKLGAELPIVEGTAPEDLERGVGHFKGSYFPDENGQIVLSGHRDTVFRRTGDLELGDIFTLKMPYGEYSYELIETKIVPADDTSIINLQESEEELILTTCYPFSFIGDAPDRYIMYAKRVDDQRK